MQHCCVLSRKMASDVGVCDGHCNRKSGRAKNCRHPSGDRKSPRMDEGIAVALYREDLQCLHLGSLVSGWPPAVLCLPRQSLYLAHCRLAFLENPYFLKWGGQRPSVLFFQRFLDKRANSPYGPPTLIAETNRPKGGALTSLFKEARPIGSSRSVQLYFHLPTPTTGEQSVKIWIFPDQSLWDAFGANQGFPWKAPGKSLKYFGCIFPESWDDSDSSVSGTRKCKPAGSFGSTFAWSLSPPSLRVFLSKTLLQPSHAFPRWCSKIVFACFGLFLGQFTGWPRNRRNRFPTNRARNRNRWNRFPGTETVFQEPSSLLNCTETHKNPLLRGTTGTENRNRSNRSIPKP